MARPPNSQPPRKRGPPFSSQPLRERSVMVKVTADEYAALEMVKVARRLNGISLVLREMSLREVVAEAERLRKEWPAVAG